MSKLKRPDPSKILEGLKDFQRETVEYVFRRMYLDSNPANRFLVADEVGLGKTMIARGVIAKAVDHLWNDDRRIDIVYVCSNADIARQNVGTLNFLGSRQAFATRLTLLAITLQKLQKEKVNFVSFTPATSFDVNSTGWSLERVLMYYLINNHIENGSYEQMTRALAANSSLEAFRRQVDSFPHYHSPHSKIQNNFGERLELQENLHILKRFREVCHAMPSSKVELPKEIKQECKRLIAELRRVLAEASMHWLEPDLVILDEFQRFKDLLNNDSEEPNPAAELANRLFEFREKPDDPSTEARVLLLSATPYKMYTMRHERELDDHYADFHATLRFLMRDSTRVDNTISAINDYRESMWRLSEGTSALSAAKERLTESLRSVMVRTERLAASTNRAGMLDESSRVQSVLAKSDLRQLKAMRELTELVESRDLLSYWKSAPYLLNFMDEYDFKRRVHQFFERSKQSEDFVSAFRAARPALLTRKSVEAYEAVDPANPMLRGLQQATVDRGAWRLLWVPPGRPYYQPSGVYSEECAGSMTKTLVFSAWKIVPKVVASLLSYEAERQMFHSLNRQVTNTESERKKRKQLLRTDGKSMTTFALIYPCSYLAGQFDPAVTTQSAGPGLELRDLKTLVNEYAQVLEAKLGPILTRFESESSKVDRNWFWVAPILLDYLSNPNRFGLWVQELERGNITPLGEDGERPKGWTEQVEQIVTLWNNLKQTGKPIGLGKPPKQLLKVLATLAIAGPGVCALRSLRRSTVTRSSDSVARWNAAKQIASGFIHLFNLPEVTYMVRGLFRVQSKRKVPYWRLALQYCAHGNLQALLDEYLHLLLGKPSVSTRKSAEGIEQCDPCESASRDFRESICFRTSTIKADMYSIGRSEVRIDDPVRFRTRFAVAFGDQKDEEAVDGSKQTLGSRKEQVRAAFNSPFWPFVLVSTSVGQEGLDFHNYCHSVLHWNLPSNPVDLEQREGRVHRFKSHALRRNIAWQFNDLSIKSGEDVWGNLFEAAIAARKPGQNDLYPFWICEEGPAKIERIVPTLPLSRERNHHRQLMKTLTAYRLVFGQNRQQDLVEFLLRNVNPAELEQAMSNCCIDLSPKS